MNTKKYSRIFRSEVLGWAIPIFLFAIATNALHAQDTLHLRKGGQKVVKIIEAGSAWVKYLHVDGTDTMNHVISKEVLSKITYASGLIDSIPVMDTNPMAKRLQLDPRIKDYGKNFFAVNVTDFFFQLATVSYERIFKLGYLGMKIPFSYGMIAEDQPFEESYDDSRIYYYSTNKIFSVGMDLNFYPSSQGLVRYFAGPSFEYGQVYFWHQDYYRADLPVRSRSPYYAVLFQNGLLVQPLKHLNFSLHFAMGYSQFFPNYSYISTQGYLIEEDNVRSNLTLRIGLSFGYKF